MDREALAKAMKASISEVLETMFFMPVDFVTTDDTSVAWEKQSDDIRVRLDFGGPRQGSFRLVVPAGLARQVSADFLGIDPGQASWEEMTGTAKEMINMFVGNTLSRYDPEAVFDLGVPELMPADTPDAGGKAEPEWIRLDVQTPESRMAITVDRPMVRAHA